MRQEIRFVEVQVVTDYEVEHDDHKVRHDHVLARHRVSDAFALEPGEERSFRFSMRLPHTTPVTVKGQRVWVHTELDISGGVDSGDKDPLTVGPAPLMQRVLDGMVQLGFHLNEARCEKGRGAGVPFVQEFEFRPTGGFYRGRVDEVDVVLRGDEGGLDVLLEVDRKARGFGGFLAEAFDADERYVRLHFDGSEAAYGPDHFAQRLHGAMERHAR